MNTFQFAWRDFKKQKLKSIFAILGVMIAIFLLTAIGMLIDSLSYSFLDVATAQSGSSDLIITKSISPDLTFNPYMNHSYIESTADIEEIDNYYPRILNFIDMETKQTIDDPTRVMFYAINSTLEQESGKMGDLILCDPITLEETGEIYDNPIPEGRVIILKNTAKIYSLSVGDWMILTYTRYSINVTVDAVCVQKLKFSAVESNLVIMELEQAQSFLDKPNEANYIMATFKNPGRIYDTRNIEATTTRIRDIGEKIQRVIGFEYIISAPKLSEVENSEFMTTLMNTMMIFVSIVAMLISGILINSILTTSIEERIREFGIMRVVGSKKRENMQIVLYQGILIAIFGTTAGVAIGIASVPFWLWLISSLSVIWSKGIPMIWNFQTIIQSIVVGIVVTVAISLLPALKAGKIEISSAVDPYRRDQHQKYKLKKEGSSNFRIMLIGIAVSTAGLLVFIFLPRLLLAEDLILVLSLFITLLLAILIGLVFALVGIVPAIEWVIVHIFKPFISKIFPIVQLGLKRNRRRNQGNILLFSLSFSFIFFFSTFIVMRAQITTNSLENTYGSDLVLINQGSEATRDNVDFNLYDQVSQTIGIKSTAPLMYNTIDLTEIISVLVTALEQGVDPESIAESFRRIFSINKIETYIGSITFNKYVECGLFGVNQEYVDISNNDFFIWDKSSGSNDNSFKQIFDTSRNDTIIISKNIAEYIGVTEIGDQVRMVFAEPGKENQNTGKAITFTVAGISAGMPGIWNFGSSQASIWGAGVMMSIENYVKYIYPNEPLTQATPIDKILINLEDTSTESINDAKTLITDLYGTNYRILVDDNVSKIKLFTQNDQVIDIIMQVLLILTIIIALFGLISTMYSSLLERMFEVGLLRAMGLQKNDVRKIFIFESLSMMLSSGTMGTIVGTFIAYQMIANVAILLETPVVFVFSTAAFLRTYLLSISICIVGVLFITRRVSQWSIMEIFRKTF
ncbi:MAG: ABC transporter permease [Candidatus Lokiarchaeota archaeon]|nr:ABC transporter permease [Candidatus Lokiarchaeota archaeon]